MTKDIFAIFCSKMNVKRLFNMTKNVINYRRDRLNAKIIEIIIIIKYVKLMNNRYCIDDKSSNIVNEIFGNELFIDVFDFLSFVMIDDDIDNNEKLIM